MPPEAAARRREPGLQQEPGTVLFDIAASAIIVISVASATLLAGLFLRRGVYAALARWQARRFHRARAIVRDWVVEGIIPGRGAWSPPLEVILEEAVEVCLMSDGVRRLQLRGLIDALGLVSDRFLVDIRSPRRRLRLVYLLSFFGGDSVIDCLRRTLASDTDPSVRLSAGKALAEIGGLPPLDEVVRHLGIEDHESSRVAFTIFRAVAMDRVGELAALAAPGRSEATRLVAVDALGHSGMEEAIAPVVAALGDGTLEVRAAALRALGRLDARGAADAVLDALGDPDWVIRCQAAICAGRLRIEAAIPVLEKLLDDPYWWVRLRSVEAMGVIGGHAIERLRDAAARADEIGRLAQIALSRRAA